MTRKVTEETTHQKFLIWTKKNLKHKARFRGFNSNWAKWLKIRNQKPKNYQRIWHQRMLSLNQAEKHLNPNFMNSKRNMNKSAEPMPKIKKFGRRTEPWWKAKSNSKQLQSKSWRSKDRLWLPNMKRSAMRHLFLTRKQWTKTRKELDKCKTKSKSSNK